MASPASFPEPGKDKAANPIIGAGTVVIDNLCADMLGGLLFRYGSVDPCEWLRYDMTAKTGLPRIMVDAAVQIKLKGDMGAGNCFGEWLRFHKDGE